MKRQFRLVTVLALIATFVFGSAGTVGAAGTTVVVTPPLNSQGWSTNDTAADGVVTFVNGDAPSGGGTGSLQLSTTTPAGKAQYIHAAGTPLSSVTELSYYTKQISPPGPVADPAYQLITFLNGGTSGFTTLVFEPYQNTPQGPVMNNVWQPWDVDAGLFWSTRTVTCSGGIIAGTPGGPATYTLAQVTSMCPSAIVAAFGVNIGTNNPSYTVRTDLVDFNGTTYNFEVYNVPTDKDQCKNGGWQTFNPPDGPYKNQGQCVSSTNH